jgi:hypothetical protein
MKARDRQSFFLRRLNAAVRKTHSDRMRAARVKGAQRFVNVPIKLVRKNRNAFFSCQ